MRLNRSDIKGRYDLAPSHEFGNIPTRLHADPRQEKMADSAHCGLAVDVSSNIHFIYLIHRHIALRIFHVDAGTQE